MPPDEGDKLSPVEGERVLGSQYRPEAKLYDHAGFLQSVLCMFRFIPRAQL